MLFSVLQVAVLFCVRSIVAESAADGARSAVAPGVDYARGGLRASDVASKGLAEEMARLLGA